MNISKPKFTNERGGGVRKSDLETAGLGRGIQNWIRNSFN